jgi:succinoglycan biosynthesis protein ExoO
VSVCVIMANYNGAAFLRQAVASIRAQTLTDWRLVLVDDASVDESPAIAAELAAADRRIEVVRLDQNRGPAGARNAGLDRADGDWWAIVDADDQLEPDRLARLVQVGEATAADIVADNLTVFSAAVPGGAPNLRGRWAGSRWLSLADFAGSSRLYTASPDLGYLKPLLRARAVRRAGVRYDERLRIGEDFDFLLRLLGRGLDFWLEGAPLYRYRKHPDSISHRCRAEDLTALIISHDEVCASLGSLGPDAVTALKRRRRSLESMLAYDRVIEDLKTRRIGEAAFRAVRRPAMWPLLGRPLGARLARMVVG